LKRNIYTHAIELKKLRIKNRPREEFRNILEKVKYLGYEVETLKDGRRIVISKPGGKFVYGKVKREDFMVWVYDPSNLTLWLISHKDIYEDLEQKGLNDPKKTVRMIDALDRVCKGEEPGEVLKSSKLAEIDIGGERLEVLLKAYKWIWGQEDCNYPDGEGREMSMSGIRALRESLKKKIAKR
jgi:hypothetical protein